MKHTLLLCSLLTACYGESGAQTVADGGASDATTAKDVLTGTVLDERNDSIEFTATGPVHTHGGAPIDLSSGCPDVYKYAYLESARDYGSEVAPNPFAYHVTSDAATASYRVTSDAGTVVVDTTSLDRTSAGDYVVDLRGGQIAALAGKMTLTVTLGATTLSACFVNHPMAAPLQYNTPTSGELQSDKFPALFLSRAMNVGAGISVAKLTFTQYTAEPIHLVLTLDPIAAQARGEVVDGYVPIGAAFAATFNCGGMCNGPAALSRREVPAQPLAAIWNFAITSTGNQQATCTVTDGRNADCMIPARTNGTAQIAYTALLTLSQEKTVSPGLDLPTATSYSDQLINNLAVSGLIQSDFTQICVASSGGVCTSARDFKKVTAVNEVVLDVSTLHFTARTGIEQAVVNSAQLPAFSWDSGLAGL